MKNNVRVYPPMEATKNSEAAIEVQSEAVGWCITEYYKNSSDQPYLTEYEEKGRLSLCKRIKEGEILITYTCKDSRVVICNPKTYQKAASVHLENDEAVSWNTVGPSITFMNSLSRQLVKILKAGLLFFQDSRN